MMQTKTMNLLRSSIIKPGRAILAVIGVVMLVQTVSASGDQELFTSESEGSWYKVSAENYESLKSIQPIAGSGETVGGYLELGDTPKDIFLLVKEFQCKTEALTDEEHLVKQKNRRVQITEDRVTVVIGNGSSSNSSTKPVQVKASDLANTCSCTAVEEEGLLEMLAECKLYDAAAEMVCFLAEETTIRVGDFVRMTKDSGRGKTNLKKDQAGLVVGIHFNTSGNLIKRQGRPEYKIQLKCEVKKDKNGDYTFLENKSKKRKEKKSNGSDGKQDEKPVPVYKYLEYSNWQKLERIDATVVPVAVGGTSKTVTLQKKRRRLADVTMNRLLKEIERAQRTA